MNQNEAITVNVAELRKRLDSEELTLLDVRRRNDAEADPVVIPGAVWRDPETVAQWSSELPKDTTLAVYCVRGGPVSIGAAQALAEQGHKVLRLDGGLAAWKEAGEPLTSS